MVFFPDAYTYAPVTPFTDSSDGKVYIYAIAHAALTAKTPYLIYVNEYGNVTAAPSAIAVYTYVAVPNDTIASGALAKLQIGGYISGLITPSLSIAVGHALEMTGGAVADSGVDFTGLAGEFASCVDATTSETTANVILCGRMILTKAS